MWGNPRALSAGMEAIADEVREQTGGNFNIQIFYGGQLSAARENLDGLQLNAFEGAAICNFYHPGKNPAWMVFSLPFLPLGDPAVDKYVRSRMFEHPAIVADMEAWNALPYLSGLLPHQRAPLVASFRLQGLHLEHYHIRDNWLTLVFSKP